MKTDLKSLVQLLESGKCPHTGRRYDCARCTFGRPTLECGKLVHTSLVITGPLYGGWDGLLIYFPAEHREGAQELLARLLQLGARVIPFGECEENHFCFKHGCLGHRNWDPKTGAAK